MLCLMYAPLPCEGRESGKGREVGREEESGKGRRESGKGRRESGEGRREKMKREMHFL